MKFLISGSFTCLCIRRSRGRLDRIESLHSICDPAELLSRILSADKCRRFSHNLPRILASGVVALGVLS